MSAANSSTNQAMMIMAAPPAKPSQAMMIMGAPPSKPAAENKKQTVTPSNSLNLSAVHPSDGQPAFLPALPSPKTFRKGSITESDYKKQNSMNEEM